MTNEGTLDPGACGQSGGTVSAVLYVPRRPADPSACRVWLQWRGQAIASPPSVQAVAPGTRVRVLRRWSEQGVPFLKLADADSNSEVDCSLSRLLGEGQPSFALLEMAPGWPGPEARHRTLVRIEGPDTLCTLTQEEFDAAFHRWRALIFEGSACGVAEAQAVFGPMPDWLSPEFRAQHGAQHEEPERPVYCFLCSQPIADCQATCPHCGVSRLAPNCPHCGGLVSSERDKRVYYTDENGYYPWHHAWDGRCGCCGFEFVAQLVLETGHRGWPASGEEWDAAIKKLMSSPSGRNPLAGLSRLEIRPGESIHMVCDDWDYQPTIEVHVRRTGAANMTDPARSLTKEAHIVMTLAEWQAIIDCLQGPLRVLMHRRPWSRDTT